MHVLIVYAHPEPSSLNAALRDAAVEAFQSKGHQVKVSDLYAMNFDPVFKKEDFLSRNDTRVFRPYPEALHAVQTGTIAKDIREEMEKVKWADLVILQFPVWFTSWPAIMKGWIDRVFQAGFAFTYADMYDRGLLKGKKAALLVTTGSPQAVYTDGGMHGDLDELLKSITRSTLGCAGFEVLPSYHVFNAGGLSKEQGMAEIRRLKEHILAL